MHIGKNHHARFVIQKNIFLGSKGIAIDAQSIKNGVKKTVKVI